MGFTFRCANGCALFAIAAVLVSLVRAGAQVPAPDVVRGEHIATALAGCADCHGANFAGGRSFTRGGVTVVAANLTPGAGGISGVSAADLRRAIRAGVGPDGRALVVMPWREYAGMTDADVDDLIAYLQSLPPVDNVMPAPPSAAPRAPDSAQQAGSLAAESDRPPPGTGAYLATIGGCRNCHGSNLAGGPRPTGQIAPNISRDGIGSWSFTDFQTAMRTGATPTGHVLSGEMPWKSIGKMTTAELRMLYEYLEAQPAQTPQSP